MNLRFRSASILLTLLPLAILWLGSTAPKVFEEETSVVLVELPVQVLRNGRPVRGLTRDDFVVFDRGTRRELVDFEVIDLGDSSGQAGEPTAPPSPSSARTFLFVFDLAYSDSASLQKAVDAARSLVDERLRPGDRTSVAFFSALRGTRLLSPLAADPGLTLTALDMIEAMLARDPELAGEAYDALEGRLTSMPAALISREELVAEAGIVVRADRFWPHRSVLRSLMRGLRDLPAGLGFQPTGQKHLLFLSSGFEDRFLLGVGSSGTLGEMEKVFGEMRRTGWAIQAVNVGGLGTLAGRNSLFYMAHETGGESFEHFNDLDEAFGQLLRRTSVTYLLVFRADDVQADGRMRRVRVELRNRGRGVRLVHRPGYQAPEPPEPTVRPRAPRPDATATAR